MSKFWKKHKTEILIGAAALAVVTVIAVVAIFASAAAGSVAAVGGALDLKKRKEPEAPKQKGNRSSPKREPATSLPPTNTFEGDPYSSYDLLKQEVPQEESLSQPFSPPRSQSSTTHVAFEESGIRIGNLYSSYRDLLKEVQRESLLEPSPSMTSQLPSEIPDQIFSPQLDVPNIPPASNTSWIATILDVVGKSMIDPDLIHPDSENLPPQKPPSSRFSTIGKKEPRLRIGGINGMNTSFEEAAAHAQYTANLASNQSIDWVHNQSHGPVIDFLEVFTLNYMGCSPNNARMLQENWKAFHEDNADSSHAKYLQICHSQGALHVRNALANCPKEIRDRVIVIAIAPAAIMPREVCYESYNYASKKDVVSYGELVAASALNPNECGMSKRLEMAMEHREELILLDPHPDATGIDHDYESPTFLEKLKKHLEDYLIVKHGEYK